MPTLSLSSAEAFQLTEDEDEALLTLVDELEADALRVRREHLDDHKHRVDLKTWEPIKTKAKHQLAVYKERAVGSLSWKHAREFNAASSQNSSFYGSSTRASIQAAVATAQQARVPLLMAQGTLEGTVDDYLYGHFVHDSQSLRILHGTSKLHIADCALLWPTEQASMTKPYRFAGVVWLLAKLPGMGFVKHRDALQFMRQRIAHTVEGSDLGVLSSISIAHADFPDFSEQRIVRMRNASVVVLRQVDEQHVDCFMLTSFDTHGNIPESYATSLAVSEILAVESLPERALEKKLQYAMRHKKRPAPNAVKEPTTSDKQCGSCGKTAHARLLGQNTCSLCTKPTCSECRVTKKLCIGATGDKLTTHRFMFCLACIEQCKALSTELVAKNELEERDLMLIKRERNSAVLEV